jgi:hypothetical protein
MARVVRLKADEHLPTDGNWVLVERDQSGKYVASGSVTAHSRGATFYVPEPPLHLESEAAVAKAVLWAERHGVEIVYVREAADSTRT